MERPIRCEHCYQREDRGPLSKIVGPIRTSFRHVCRFCGDVAYVSYGLDEEDNAVLESPGAGHIYESRSPDGACDVCHRPL